MGITELYNGWTILVDCDGCLTDGKKVVNSFGEREFINFHSRDSTACQMLAQIGFQVIVLTHSKFDGIAEYWHKYGAHVFSPEGGDMMTNKLKVEDTYTIDWEKTIAIGDDITDLCFMKAAKYSYYVCDAHPAFKTSLLHTRLPCKGGEGVLTHIYQHAKNGEYE